MSPFNRLFSFMTKPWIVSSMTLLMILLFFYGDRPLSEWLNSVDLHAHIKAISWLTKLGINIIYLSLFLVGALFFRYVRINRIFEARFWFLWWCVALTAGFCGFFKVLLGRARPSLWFNEQAYGFYGFKTEAAFWSFPSGHTTTIMALTFGLSILFPRYIYAYVIAGLLVAASRVLLVQHYLSDVLSAAYLTLLEIGLLLWVLQKKSYLKPVFKKQGEVPY